METISYESWKASEVAAYILNEINKQVENAKQNEIKQLLLDYEMEVLEDGVTRKLYDYELLYVRNLLRGQGYNLPSESELEDGFIVHRDSQGEILRKNAPYYNWVTPEQRAIDKKRTTIFIVIMVIAVIGILLGQAWIYDLI